MSKFWRLDRVEPTWYHWLWIGVMLALSAFVLLVWAPAALGPKGKPARDMSHISLKSSAPDNLTNPAGFRMQTDEPIYGTESTQLNIVLFNDTDQQANFGMAYALEVFRAGGWYSVPFKKLPDGVVRAWLAYATRLPAHGSKTDTIDLAEHEPLEPGNYRLIKDILLDGQPGVDLEARTRKVWCPFTIASADQLPAARRERDAIDGCLFAIDLLLEKAGQFSSGAKWLAVDTSNLTFLTDENKTRFFTGLERHGLRLRENTRAELISEGLIRQGRFDQGLLIEFIYTPASVPGTSQMVFWTQIWRADAEVFKYDMLRIAYFGGRWELFSDQPYSIA